MEKKVYNLKQSSLGKITFLSGTCFIGMNFRADNGEKINEIVIMPSIEDGLKVFPKIAFKLTNQHISEPLVFHNKVINWLIENWLEKGIVSFKTELAEKYGFKDFLNQDPIEWIKAEPEMVGLTLVHIASRYTNGFLKLPSELNDVEITVKFIKNILAVNFWEEGNPKSSEPIK
ncbi:hypothetical protein [Spiroplasma clarkii]|uniref:Uncharacterized protein n=1 Tax=Spiroplasma clarkii TaxID=2139 RepID=A0A2K8KH42_9MOLU|nr:hypothetical protein [Spiroplasma clarkii]ATX71000.1 hypothetical protein SCLAR_v1c06830 [Spiroplasma clarkii]